MLVGKEPVSEGRRGSTRSGSEERTPLRWCGYKRDIQPCSKSTSEISGSLAGGRGKAAMIGERPDLSVAGPRWLLRSGRRASNCRESSSRDAVLGEGCNFTLLGSLPSTPNTRFAEALWSRMVGFAGFFPCFFPETADSSSPSVNSSSASCDEG